MKALASHTVHLTKVLTFYALGTDTGVLHATDGRATVRILALHRLYCPTEVEARWWYSFGETMQNVNKF